MQYDIQYTNSDDDELYKEIKNLKNQLAAKDASDEVKE